MRETGRPLLVSAALIVGLLASVPASAQSTERIRLRGFADFGSLWLTSKQSFQAVVGRDDGPVWGGGIEIVQRPGWFLQVRASRYKRTGQRVFLFSGQLFTLGIPVDVELRPLDITGGFRVERGWPVTPYGGIGYESIGYKETSKFADAGENLDQRFGGVHLLAGADVQVWRWFGVAGEVSWSRIANALGKEGISKEYGETDLGGTTARVKFVFGR